MEAKNINIIFMGTSGFAKEILASLIGNGYKIRAVITQPDKKVGRKQELKSSPIKEFSSAQNIPIFQPYKLDEEAIMEIDNMEPDLIIVAAYGKIIPSLILEMPKYKSINVHPSLLPKFRGPSPIQNALLQGEKETGTTIMLMDEKMDHGDILMQKKVEISDNDNLETLTDKLTKKSIELLLETIPLWVEKKIEPKKQDDSQATYCQLIEREDGHIFWSEEAETTFNKYRAFHPWPGIFSFIKNGNHIIRIKLNKISLDKSYVGNRQPGEVFKKDNEIAVATPKGIIVLEEIQAEGKKPVSINDFVNGYPKLIGSILI